MKKFLRSPAVLILLLAAPIFLFGWYAQSRRTNLELLDTDPTITRNRTKEIGGIERPISDIGARSRQVNQIAADLRAGTAYSRDIGIVTCAKTPVFQPGQNAQADSVIEAIKTGEKFERISPWLKPTTFDAAEWEKNPTAYLSVAESGRVFDVAQPAEGVPPIKNVSSAFALLREGESVRISAKSKPKAPISFTLFGNGKFENGLGTITVAADEEGVASAVYVGMTAARAEILAGSPLSSGTLRYRVNVLP